MCVTKTTFLKFIPLGWQRLKKTLLLLELQLKSAEQYLLNHFVVLKLILLIVSNRYLQLVKALKQISLHFKYLSFK